MKIEIDTNIPIPTSGPDMAGNVYPCRGGFAARSAGEATMTNNDLVKRLREHATDWDGMQMPDLEPAKGDPTAGTLREAADRIEQLEAENARLRSALEFTQPAIAVLSNMLKARDLRLGVAKCHEVADVLRSALASQKETPDDQ